MHNRPDNPRLCGEFASRAAPGSGLRLLLLFAVIVAVVCGIGGRAIWLQTVGRDRFTTLWDRTNERTEPIPAHDGRILTADGQVLAYDQPRYSVVVHYRWLEEPADAAWLTSQARDRLDSRARRDRSRVDAERARVLSERNAMHAHLAAVLGLSIAELRQRFRPIQNRVERIVASVDERRRSQESPEDGRDTGGPNSSTAAALEERPGWRGVWREIRRELTTPPARPRRDPLVVAEELQYHEVAVAESPRLIGRIESYPSRFPGVEVRMNTRRVYPLGKRASHLVGARTPLRADELAARAKRFPNGDPRGYRAGESVGRSGVELAHDATLHGVGGERRIVTNRRGEILSQEVTRAPVHGRDVVLSIDGRLQAAAETLLDAVVEEGRLPRSPDEDATSDSQSTAAPQPVGGCLVAIDVRSGEVVAAASSPRHDARLFESASNDEWNATASDPRRPFFPRVTQGTLPPGSLFKLLTAVAGLEARAIDPEEPFDCRGYLHRPDRDRCAIYRHFGVGHGVVTLDEAIAQSCNVYFFDAAQRIGPGPIVKWARQFGFGRPSGCDIPSEKGGHLPSPHGQQSKGERWYPGTTRQLAIGQASLTVTPLQVVRMVAAIANDGWLVTPQFVRDVGTDADEHSSFGSSTPIQLASFIVEEQTDSMRPLRIPGLSRDTLSQVRSGMEQAVEHPRGTGHDAHLQGIRIAGKTGTAEIGGGRPDHAWFAGYAPAETPRIAFVVVIEQGGSGGRVAAPIAREFVRSWGESRQVVLP